MSTRKVDVANSYFKDVNPNSNDESLFDEGINIQGKIQILDAIQEICCHKKKEKERSSKTHVDHFLKNHFILKKKEYEIKTCEDLTFEFMKNEGDQFVNCLATFLLQPHFSLPIILLEHCAGQFWTQCPSSWWWK